MKEDQNKKKHAGKRGENNAPGVELKAGEALISQPQILEKILELSPVGICLVENRIFKWVNNEMLKLFGYEKKQDFENADAQMIYSSYADYETAGKMIYHDLKEKGKSDFDFDLKRKDGTIFKAQIIITVPGFKNARKTTIVIIADISQREAAQKEKLEKEKLQGVLEMAGAVCHEINQPISAVSQTMPVTRAVSSRTVSISRIPSMLFCTQVPSSPRRRTASIIRSAIRSTGSSSCRRNTISGQGLR